MNQNISINLHKGSSALIEELPDKCPHCHIKVTPNVISGYYNSNTNLAEILMFCPNSKCSKSFIGYYKYRTGYSIVDYQSYTSQGSLVGRSFSDTITEISTSFIIIYNQSYAAEQQNLFEICGVGYRKALEFLIKDYSIKNHPTEKEHIEKLLLGPCIQKYITDSSIKSVSKRAVWLGNDETHYIRKWEGKNLTDMKKLIDLVLHWMEAESLTKSFEDEMPE